MKTLPLSPVRFHILLSLIRNPARARDIASRVAMDTFGEIELSPATLHDNLQIMIRHDWIEFRRNYIYGITLSGYQLLENDLYS